MSKMSREAELFDGLSSFEKSLATEQLNYLPYLYYRKYKQLEMLAQLRHEFPQQKVMVPRSTTPWDTLLFEVQVRSMAMREGKKCRMVERMHLAKAAKLDFIKNELKKEQKMLFHRLVCSQLAEQVTVSFNRLQTPLPAKVEIMEQKKVHDDSNIFIGDLGLDDNYSILFGDLVGEIFNEPLQHTDPQPTIGSIEEYKNKMRRSMRDESEEQGSKVARNYILKRINQNVRRRAKLKEEEEEQERSLGSATVFLSSMLQAGAEDAINDVQLKSTTQWLFEGEGSRKRRDQWELKWTEEDFMKLENPVEKNSMKRGKIDQSLLLLHLNNEEEEYKKIFQKNIASSKGFPKSIKSIQKVSLRRQSTKYYNEFYDPEYEQFVMAHNKRNLLDRFQKNAPYLFVEQYSQSLQPIENISLAKSFVYPPNKVWNKLVYKLTGDKLRATVKEDQDFGLDLDGSRLVLIAYLVQKYLREFGNNWKLIAHFVSIHPCFGQTCVTAQLIQQVYQLIQRRQQLPLRVTDLWEKKVLPFDTYNSQSYVEYRPSLFPSYSSSLPPRIAPSTDFDLESYQKAIEEECEEVQTSASQEQTAFREYQSKITDQKLLMRTTHQQQRQEIRRVLDSFKSNKVVNEVQGEREVNWVFDYVVDHLKGEIKTNVPIRKKKKITQSNNQLVKLLRTLGSKQSTNVAVTHQVREPLKIAVTPPPSIKPLLEERKTIVQMPENKSQPGLNKKKRSKHPDDKS